MLEEIRRILRPTPGERVATKMAVCALPQFTDTPEKRAFRLLMELLAPVQQDDLLLNQGFNLRAADKKVYRIVRKDYGENNILTLGRFRGHLVVDGAETVIRIGVWPRYWGSASPILSDYRDRIPYSDVIIGQVLGMRDPLLWTRMKAQACAFVQRDQKNSALLGDYDGQI